MNKAELTRSLQFGAAPEPQEKNQNLSQNPQGFMNAVANQYTAMTNPSAASTAKASAQNSNTCAHCGQDIPQASGVGPAAGLGTQGS